MGIDGVIAEKTTIEAPLEVVGRGAYIGFPSMTTTMRDAITDLAAGRVIWNSTTGQLESYNGTNWQPTTMRVGIYGVSCYGQCVYG